MSDTEQLVTRRADCVGAMPLTARLQPWMIELVERRSEKLQESVKRHGSPLNLIHPDTLKVHIHALREAASRRELDFEVYFARKANKCLAFVDAANDIGAGIDVASFEELTQVTDRQIPPERIICTAAIKSEPLLTACLRHQIVVAVDNDDELHQVMDLSERLGLDAKLALRFGGFVHNGTKLHTRFGFDVDEAGRLARDTLPRYRARVNSIEGVHFHLDGYCPEQRVSAITQSLEILDQFRETGFRPKFLDIGGGLPMSYLESSEQWDAFWQSHRKSLLGAGPALTHRGHGLGLACIDGQVVGRPNVYPYYQNPIREEWLAKILDAKPDSHGTISKQVRSRDVQLRCEPGRSVLDGCGLTIARVEFVKRHHTGHHYVGLAMNRTQCRTSSDDFLVDPILVRADRSAAADDSEVTGFLVGAYCTESELILQRKLRFPNGVRREDLILLPNTAGYFMHFLESRSHQLPLAKNLVVDEDQTQPWTVDGIDA